MDSSQPIDSLEQALRAGLVSSADKLRVTLVDGSVVAGMYHALQPAELLITVKDAGPQPVERARIVRIERRTTSTKRFGCSLGVVSALALSTMCYQHAGVVGAAPARSADVLVMALIGFVIGAIPGLVFGGVIGFFVPRWEVLYPF